MDGQGRDVGYYVQASKSSMIENLVREATRR
jgi:hypothetical protein